MSFRATWLTDIAGAAQAPARPRRFLPGSAGNALSAAGSPQPIFRLTPAYAAAWADLDSCMHVYCWCCIIAVLGENPGVCSLLFDVSKIADTLVSLPHVAGLDSFWWHCCHD